MRFDLVRILIVVGVVLGSVRAASAQCDCTQCTCEEVGQSTSWDLGVPAPEPSPRGDFETSTGGNTGLRQVAATAAQVQFPALAPAFAALGTGAEVDVVSDEANACADTATYDAEPLAALVCSPIDGPIAVPDPQGVTQSISPTGEGSAGNQMLDPVDPVTGEYVIRHVDLELPSFGVPFRLVRTYRSRVNFAGPLGPAWDHTFDQRLVEAPRVAVDSPDPLPPVYDQLGVGSVQIPMFGTATCGPVLMLATGEATSIRFNELVTGGGTRTYTSNAALLTLTGIDAPGGPIWTLRAPGGDVRTFDDRGLLVSWVDANGVGLSIAWTGDGDAARVAAVTDSVDRMITFEYDAANRLIRVSEPRSELEASYDYDPDGALATAHDADGRSERYEYDVDPARDRAGWVAEQPLRLACASACAASDSATCDTGGACDAPVAAAMAECLAWVNTECDGECLHACRDLCEPDCDVACETDPEYLQNQIDECQRLWDEGVHAACDACDDACRDGAITHCDQLVQEPPPEGLPYSFTLGTCYDTLTDCCADGAGCAAGSCNAGESCEDTCEQAFFGTQEVQTACQRDCGPSVPGMCDYPHPLAGCRKSARDTCKADCTAGCAGAGCTSTCQAGCDPSTCVALDLEATCESSCTGSCVRAGELAGGDLLVYHYGQETDLDFNIVRVYDGADRMVLQNVYGTDLRSPDFDSIVSQAFGDSIPQLARWDLVNDPSAQATLPPWAAAQIAPAAAFEPVEICPATCRELPTNETGVFVPEDGLVMAFPAQSIAAPVTGFTVNKTLPQVVWPTLVTFSRNQAGTVIGAISRRTSTTNYLATTATSIPMTLNGGATVTLATSTTGAVTVTGTTAGKDQLIQIGRMTLFTDAAKHVIAYPGFPIEVLKVTSGSCTQPFTVQAVSDTEIRLSPATACQGELWLTPFAGQVPDPAQAAAFPRDGLAALHTSALHPTALAPTRAGSIWRSGIDGRRVREAPPSTAGQNAAKTAAPAQYAKAPMFSAPTQTSGASDPLFVFHHAAPDYRISTPMPVPSDLPWADLDAVISVPITCDPGLPSAAIHGSGARPTQASAVVDLDGARWTLYADDHNRVLRTINHDTGALWSFEYDPDGQVTGIEHPDRARTCLRHDAHGNVTRRVDLPAVVPGLPTPDPIIADVTYHPVSSTPTFIMDPRFPGAVLRQIDRDTNGNPTAIHEADGTTTTVTRVGGSGPTRGEIATVVRPGAVEDRIAYDLAGGTAGTFTLDATGAALVDEQVHDDAGRVVSTESPLGLEQTRSYDGPRLAFADWTGDGHSGRQSFTYDADGLIDSVVVGIPGAEKYRGEITHDITGAVRKVKRIALDGSATTAVECHDISAGGRVRESVSAEGVRVRYQYDGEGRVRSVATGDLGPSSRPWDDGCLDHPTGGTEQFTVATYTYDTSGRVIASTDERNRLTTITNDGFGRPVMMNRPDGTQLRRGYDAMGNMLWEALYSTALAPAYRPPSWTDGGLQAATELAYDSRARLAEVKRWHFEGAQVPVGDGLSTTRFIYNDAQHTVTRVDDANSSWVTRRDGAGRVIEELAPDGSKRTFSYPDRRTVRITEPGPTGSITRELALTAWGAASAEGMRVGTTLHSLATSQFDELLRPTTITSHTGESDTLAYDAFGRIRSQQHTVPGGASETVTPTYNRDGQMVTRASTATSATTGSWAWSYDGLGRQKLARDPANKQTTTSYVLGSELPATITDPRGVQFVHTWAATANQLSLTAIDPAGPDVSLTYVWDARGNLVSAGRTDEGTAAITSSFLYDSLGGKTREADNQLPTAWARTAQYNGRGLRAKTTVNTTSWTRSYDPLGRLGDIKVGTESTALAKYTYAGFDFRLTRNLQNGIETRSSYDELGRQVGQTDVLGATNVAIWAWPTPLDGVPRRADLRRNLAGADNSVFTVDAALRLLKEDATATSTFGLAATTSFTTANTTATAAQGPETWRYTLDGRSAWTQRIRGTTGTTTYTRDARDALTRINATNVTLDARGAITNDGGSTASYDALGLVKQITVAPGTKSYRRDALGRVVTETDQAGQITRYAYDGTTRVVRQRPGGTTYDVTIDGAALDEHVATLTGSARQFLHQDRSGSVYLVSNTSGAPLEWTSYTAYGEPTLRGPTGTAITASAVNAQYGFNGLPHDFGLGVVDMRARTYRPVLGRFLSPDPLGLAAGTNRFGFVGAAPLGFRDPFGLDGIAVIHGYLDFVGVDPGPNYNWNNLHGMGAEQAVHAVSAYINAHSNDPCVTGRGHCWIDGAASTFAGVGDNLTLGWGGYARSCWNINIVDQDSWDYSVGSWGSLAIPIASELLGARLLRAGLAADAAAGEMAAMDTTAAADTAVADTASTAADTAAPAAPNAHSVAYEMTLDPADFGRSRDVQANRANAALDADIRADPEFAAGMQETIPGVADDVSRVGGRETPDGWRWHHADSPGVMQLVPEFQHTPGSAWWRILHPSPGAQGGYSKWGIPAGAPKN